MARSELAEELELAQQRAWLDDATVESLLAELNTLEVMSGDEQNQTRVFLRIKALVTLQPESCVVLGEHLSTARASKPAISVLAGALAAAGSPEAQMALVRAITARHQDWPALAILVPELATVEKPTREAEQVLWDLVREATDENIRTTAELALGSMARRLAPVAPDRAAGIVAWSVQELDKTPGPQATRQLLLVLGNAGAVEAFPKVRPFLADPVPDVRAVAVWALRWMDTPEVDAFIARTLTADGDAGVRLEAARASSFRPLSSVLLMAHARVLETDTDTEVRREIVSTLAANRNRFPAIDNLLRTVAAEDLSREVRDAAADALMTGPGD
jgi:HEAT repeat protein